VTSICVLHRVVRHLTRPVAPCVGTSDRRGRDAESCQVLSVSDRIFPGTTSVPPRGDPRWVGAELAETVDAAATTTRSWTELRWHNMRELWAAMLRSGGRRNDRSRNPPLERVVKDRRTQVHLFPLRGSGDLAQGDLIGDDEKIVPPHRRRSRGSWGRVSSFKRYLMPRIGSGKTGVIVSAPPST
jgi:hypothetical protein